MTYYWTRMHFSRMRTVRCSCHLSYHSHSLCHAPPSMHAPSSHHTWPPTCHACPLPCTPLTMNAPPPVTTVGRVLDTPLWKHYISATTVADGNHGKAICIVGILYSESRAMNIDHEIIDVFHWSRLIGYWCQLMNIWPLQLCNACIFGRFPWGWITIDRNIREWIITLVTH